MEGVFFSRFGILFWIAVSVSLLLCLVVFFPAFLYFRSEIQTSMCYKHCVNNAEKNYRKKRMPRETKTSIMLTTECMLL